MMAKHVDDLKLAGDKDTIIWILQQIEKVFGKLKIEWNDFKNCGIKHAQNTSDWSITLDQNDYVKGIKLVEHKDMVGANPEDMCSPEVHAQYWSVLGAIAFALLTRMDIAVFVGALQRHSSKPKYIHAKKLNAVVKWAKANPMAIQFKSFESQTYTHLRMYSDAAFKKEEETGHCMRGAVYLRCPGNSVADFTKSKPCHIIEFVARQQRRVVRSTFTAELLGACDTLDKGTILAQMLHECCAGQMSAISAKQLTERGGYAVPYILYIDALSVYASITATFIKTPADNSVLFHLKYIRELLDNKVLAAMCWTDTRDMMADGLTKGTIDRQALHEAMSGLCSVGHEMKLWHSKLASTEPVPDQEQSID